MNTPLRNPNHDRELLIGCALLLALVVTRSGHFGSSIKLPDASWAMFWLSGALTTRRWWPALFMVCAAIVDYFVIAGGVSSYCVTPAYPFLIPAYLALWSAGRLVSDRLHAEPRSLLYTTASLVSGVVLAFAITNISFYLFSGYFTQLPASTYIQDVIAYLPTYLWHTAMYVSACLMLRFVIQELRAAFTSKQQSDPSSRMD